VGDVFASDQDTATEQGGLPGFGLVVNDVDVFQIEIPIVGMGWVALTPSRTRKWRSVSRCGIPDEARDNEGQCEKDDVELVNRH